MEDLDRLGDPARLLALARTGLMDTGPEEVFDRLTAFAAELLGTPIATMTLLDEHRQHFKSAVGVSGPPAPVPKSYCQYVVAGDAPFSVPDVRTEPRVAPTAAESLAQADLIAYCGVPLRDSDGHTLGSLCTMDRTPREWSQRDVDLLTRLAATAMTEIELRLANSELAAREQELAAIVAGAHDAFVGCDAEGTITQWNPAAERTFGFSAAEVMGTSVIELLVPGPRRERGRAFLGGAEAEPVDQAIETYVRHADGREVHVEVSIGRVAVGGERRYVLLIRDIGELRALERRHAHLATVVESADDAIGSVDTTGRVTAWNSASERLYGYSAAEILGQPFPATQIAGVETSPGRSLAARALAGEAVSEYGSPRRRKDGSIVYVDVNLTPLRADDGTVAGVTAIARDVTERHFLEQQLEASEERFRLTFDHAPTGVALVAVNRSLLSVNAAFCEMLGYAEDELVGRTLEGITHPDDYAADIAAAGEMLAGTRQRFVIEKRYIHRSGRIVDARLSASLVRGDDGEPLYFISQVEDVTAERVAEKAAREAQDAVQEALDLLDESQASAHVGSWSYVVDTGASQWSDEQFRLHGFPPAPRVPDGPRVMRRIDPADREAVQRAFDALVNGETDRYDCEYRTLPAQGPRRILASSATLLPADPERGLSARISGTTRDVTIAREADHARRAVEARQRQLLSSLPDTMVVLYDRELRCRLLQGPLTGWLPMSVEDYLGRELREVVPAERLALLTENIEAALAGESRSVDYHDDEHERIFQIEFAPLRGEAGEVTAAFAVWREITARVAAEAENRMLATMVQQSEDAIEAKDLEGNVTEWSGAAESLYGYTRAEAIGRPIGELILPAHLRGEEDAAMERVRAGGSIQVDTVRRRKDGRLVDVSISMSPIVDAEGRITGASVIGRDISERIRDQAARREIEERLRVTVEHAPIGVALVDLRAGVHGRLVSVNEAFGRLLGDADPVADGTSLTSIVRAEDADALRADLALLSADARARTETEVRRAGDDDEDAWWLLSAAAVPSSEGLPRLAVVHASDIGEHKRFERRLQHLADHDPLTGLFNRRRFESELARMISLVARYRYSSALLLIDLDGFKQVNDRLGHSCGDELLTRVGAALRRSLRETDVVGRLGGDEFAVVLNSVGEREAMVVAEKLLQAIERHGVIATDVDRAGVTASIGVAPFVKADGAEAESLLLEADMAMYRAKEGGRNRISLVDRAARGGTAPLAQQSWLTRLRAALERDRFELHAQPIRRICASGPERYELLLRLRGEDGGLIAPAEFLYHAERFDLIQQIDRWVFGQALELIARREAAGAPLCVSVNMSGKTLSDPALVTDLRAMLSAAPIPPDRLVVEVTETVAIVNIDRAREVARALRALGCRFALDDFGAGFASFYYLKHLEFDYLKIDGEFVRSLGENATDPLVIRSVVEIARGLGAETIAEFVGDDDAVRRLRELGVDYGQGYHLGKPGPVEELLPAPVGAAQR